MYVFTTRADTIMGVTFCAVAPEHPLADHAAKANPGLGSFIAECKRGTVIEAELATMEKKGMPTGLFVRHPLTGDNIPVWVGNYVLIAYGDGAVMGVPAHDERDFQFAKNYALPIRQVIAVAGGNVFDRRMAPGMRTRPAALHQLRQVRRLDYQHAVDAIAADLAAMGLGEKKVTWRLRDWGISRQRSGARRSRSCTARPAVTCRCRKPTCRSSCRKTACPTAPAIP